MASDRVAVLARHLASGVDRRDEGPFSALGSNNSTIAPSPASASSSSYHHSMPPVDAAAMEAALDPDAAKRAMRRQVYSVFEGRPDLLPACVEGMRKGESMVFFFCSGGDSGGHAFKGAKMMNEG